MKQPARQFELGFGYWVDEQSLPRMVFSERHPGSPAVPSTFEGVPLSPQRRLGRRLARSLRALHGWTTRVVWNRAFSVGG